MPKIVAHVREAGPSRRNLGAHFDGFRQREVCRMRGLTKRVHDEEVQPGEQWPRLVGNAAAVREVRETTYAESEYWPIAMKDRDGHDFLLSDAKRPDDAKELELRKTAAARSCGVEHVKKCSPKIVQRGLVGETGHRTLLQLVEPAHIIQSHDVIGVTVREDDRVDAADIERQRLRADVGSSIDEQRQSIIGLDVDRRTPSFVVRIGRPTRPAVAADHRHAVRRSSTEKRDAQGSGRYGSMMRFSPCCACTKRTRSS